MWALRFGVWCMNQMGRAGLRLLLAPIAAYYTLFDRRAGKASHEFFARVHRERARRDRLPQAPDTNRALNAYRHFHKFAELISDRFMLWTGRFDDFEIIIHDEEEFAPYFEPGRSAFLVGAHLGNFDILRVIARKAGIDVNVLMYADNAQHINEIFETLDPDCNVRVIDVGPSSVSAAFQIRRCVERGESVAVLADRLLPGGRSRVTRTNFLGEPASFPQGPFLLPMLMDLPVLMTLAVKTGPRRYEVFLELIAEQGSVPRADRAKELRERIEKFAARLERHTLDAPDQWFNFYDFWNEAGQAHD
jgi:predicted LPLAT superfamily acyltransferase